MAKTEGLDILVRYIVEDISDLVHGRIGSTQRSVVTQKRVTEHNRVRPSKRSWSEFLFGTHATTKEKVKDIVFTLSCLGFIVFALWVGANKDFLLSPSVSYPDGTTIRGNCSWVWTAYYAEKKEGWLNASEFTTRYSLNMSDLNKPPSAVRIMEPCPTQTTLACPTQVCPKQECVCECPSVSDVLACPVQESSPNISRTLEHQLLNIRPNANGAFGYSGGCFYCLRQAWEMLELPNRPKFNPAPSPSSTGNWSFFDPRRESDQMICFKDDSGRGDKFKVNMSTWRVVGYGNGTGMFIVEKRL